MSILTMWVDAYYEPADLIEDELDQAVCPPEMLLNGWWSASADLDDLD